jgi:hypothetical protein
MLGKPSSPARMPAFTPDRQTYSPIAEGAAQRTISRSTDSQQGRAISLLLAKFSLMSIVIVGPKDTHVAEVFMATFTMPGYPAHSGGVSLRQSDMDARRFQSEPAISNSSRAF